MIKLSHTGLRLILLTVICAAVLLFFPSSSSPLFPKAGTDYLVFNAMGHGWLDFGAVPYVRLFDHKGPLMYLIQMLGLMINPAKWGIWLLEVIFAVVTFEMLFRCGRVLKASNTLNYFAVAIAIAFFASYLQGGNCVEEWSLPFEVIPLYMVLRFIIDGKPRSVILPSLITGLCFGAVAMIRINNNCIICGLAVGIIVFLCRQLRYRDILPCIGLFAVGVAAVVLPFIAYFYFKDALDSMLYANFIFNLHYKANWVGTSASSLLINCVGLVPCLVLIVTGAYAEHSRRRNILVTLIAISVITFATFIQGVGYGHYYLMVVPIVALCMQVLSPAGKVAKYAAAAIMILYIGYFNRNIVGNNYSNIITQIDEATAYACPATQFIYDYIPEEERASIYTFGDASVGGSVVEAGHLPAGKYFFLQSSFPTVDDFVREDIRRDFMEANPLWIISSEEIKTDSVIPFSSGRYRKIPLDSLPPDFPKNMHLYRRTPA